MSQIDAALADLACYDGLEKHLPQIEWARRLLRRGKESKFGGTAAEATGPARPAKPSRPRAVVGVGIDGPDSQLVAEALRDFRGTRITGGPASGLPGPLDYWDGLLKGGVRPAEVQILTTGNGLLSFDCRLASMLGAQLAVLRPGGTTPVPPPLSFDEADPGLVYLPRDVATLRNFLAPPPVALFPTQVRDELAREFHESHRQEVMQGGPLAEWPALPEPFRQSSRELVDHIEEKLRHVGLKAYPVGGREVRLFALDETTHVEPMAELEHGRWNAERLRDGWTLGPTKDTAKKISPHLVAWADLPDGVRKWDRELVRAIPEKLRRYGWEVGPA